MVQPLSYMHNINICCQTFYILCCWMATHDNALLVHIEMIDESSTRDASKQGCYHGAVNNSHA